MMIMYEEYRFEFNLTLSHCKTRRMVKSLRNDEDDRKSGLFSNKFFFFVYLNAL